MWIYEDVFSLITNLSNSKSQIKEEGLENSAIPRKKSFNESPGSIVHIKSRNASSFRKMNAIIWNSALLLPAGCSDMLMHLWCMTNALVLLIMYILKCALSLTFIAQCSSTEEAHLSLNQAPCAHYFKLQLFLTLQVLLCRGDSSGWATVAWYCAESWVHSWHVLGIAFTRSLLFQRVLEYSVAEFC